MSALFGIGRRVFAVAGRRSSPLRLTSLRSYSIKHSAARVVRLPRRRLLNCSRRLLSCRQRFSGRQFGSPPAQTEEGPNTHARNTCSGCGSELQSADAERAGYVPREKLLQLLAAPDREPEASVEEDADERIGRRESQLTCKRCFSLKHYNTALDVTLRAEDYLRHLSHLRERRALLLLVVDVVDFPGSLFPELHSLTSPDSRVLVVANKIDLLPRDEAADRGFWKRLEAAVLDECRGSSLRGCSVVDVVFTSVKSGEGLDRLTSAVVECWGNRGDVYLLGCTNVGKSSLFNHLLQSLCGATPPGQPVEEARGVGTPPAATISHWPGTTLGLLSFPLMSMGKRRRLLGQQARVARELGLERDSVMVAATSSAEDIGSGSETAQNRCWLHDTPGAINDAQLINLLTTKELNLALPKKPLKPRTFLLCPGQCLMLGGLARLDYLHGSESAYFTVFAASYIPVHVTKASKADEVWTNNLGKPLLKLPFGDVERLARFPPLQPQQVSLTGSGWRASAADVILSSAGWVAVTAARGEEVCLMAHTPGGGGVHCRQPSLYPTAVARRGKRSRNPNLQAMFSG